MADNLEENEVTGDNFSDSTLNTEIQIESNSEELKESKSSEPLDGCAMEVNETECSRELPSSLVDEQPECMKTDDTEHELNSDLLEPSLQDFPEKSDLGFVEILPEDPINPVTTQPTAIHSNEEAAVDETQEIETKLELEEPMEVNDEDEAVSADATDNEVNAGEGGGNSDDSEKIANETDEIEAVSADATDNEVNAGEVGGNSYDDEKIVNETDEIEAVPADAADNEVNAAEVDGSSYDDAKIASETDEIEARDGSAESRDVTELTLVKSALPIASDAGNEEAARVGETNDTEMDVETFADNREPLADEELVTNEDLAPENTISSGETQSVCEPDHEVPSIVDEELTNKENCSITDVSDVPLVPSPVECSVADLVHNDAVLEKEETMAISELDSFSDLADSSQMAAVNDKTTDEGSCEAASKKSEVISDLEAIDGCHEIMSEASRIVGDLETNENTCENEAMDFNAEVQTSDPKQTSVDLKSVQDSSEISDSGDCQEAVAPIDEDKSEDKFVDDRTSDNIGSLSKLDADIAKTSDASNDATYSNEDPGDHNLRSDDSLYVKISQICDDLFKNDDAGSDISDKKSNHLEMADLSSSGSISKGKENAAADTSSSLLVDDEEEVDVKVDLDVKSVMNDKAKAVTESPPTNTSDKSAKTGASASSNRTQQKSGKNAQTSRGSKQQECIVCKKMAKCKYNIVRNDDTKHLCDDKCFQLFRNQPTTYLQADNKKSIPTDSCPQCQKQVTGNAKGRNSMKIDKEIRKFCSAVCIAAYKKTLKRCANCTKDLRNEANAVAAPIEGEGNKDFCCHACLVKYEHSKKQTTKIEEDDGDDDVEIVETTPAPKTKASSGRQSTAAKAKCAVCSKLSIVRQEANLKGVTYKLCGDGCLSTFRMMHHLAVSLCDNCKSMYSMDDGQVQTIQFEGLSKTFCSARCLSNFKAKKQRITPCTWCNTKKSNFDMVERLDANNKYQMFCSLNCLSLYRVNLQANSNQSIACDQCRKSVPALYHLTMSDASVRNFCGYNCVMTFQAQFSQPSATSGELPTPGDRVTANAANTQPVQSTLPPSQPARNSPYGTRNSSRASKSTSSPTPISPLQSSTMPVISNIVSLAAGSSAASPASNLGDNASSSTRLFAHIGVQTTATQEVIAPPNPPKQVKNKALLCKPFMQTKATSCRPHTVMKGSQTEENWEPKKLLVPCPVPAVTPTPMMMYSNPVPYPILLPIPVPIPVFIPTTKKSTAGIMKKIKELQERVPSDPFEAELLMMAEAVANANKTTNSDSDTEEEDVDTGGALIETEDSPVNLPGHTPGTNGVLGEDILRRAFQMAEMQSELTLDLEDAVDPTPIRAREPAAPVSMPTFDTIAADADILHASHMMSTPRGRGRGKRRGASRGGRGSSTAKKARVEEERVEPASTPIISPPVVAEPPADANCILKYTYGVNAYKHWAVQKNSHLERVALPKVGMRQRLFKLDLLQCSADELNYALCLFVKEVRKPNGEEYAPDSIFYLCLGIQEYLYENGRIDNIFTDFFYEKFTECLNEVLSRYEVRLNAQGMLVCRIEEEHLWEAKQLGAHSPHVLLNTLIYFNAKHFMLRSPEDHLSLSFSHIMKHWKKTSTPSGKPGRSVYLRYYAPSQLGGDGSQKRKKEELPVFEQAENVDNPLRCPVKLYEFYLSKCPESIKNRSDVFYLVPERSCVPDSPVWYSAMSLSLEGMTRMLNRLRVVREIQESQLTSLAVPYYN